MYIAYKLWTAGLLPQDIEAKKSASMGLSFLSGLLVTLGNPKTMLFYVALVPTLIDLHVIGIKEYAILVCASFTVLMAVVIPYILLASRARLLLKKPRALTLAEPDRCRDHRHNRGLYRDPRRLKNSFRNRQLSNGFSESK